MEAVIIGLLIGAVYGLMALGLALLFGVMRTINFAHGAMFMIGGYAFFEAARLAFIPPAVAVLAAPVAAFACGWLVHRLLLRPQHQARLSYPDFVLIVTFGVTIVLENLAIVIFGTNYDTPPEISTATVHITGLALGAGRFVAAGLALVATILLWWVLHHTFVGRSWRALTQSPTGATVVGIDADRLKRLAFATSCAFAGLAGGVLAPLTSVFATSGDTPLLISFVVLVIGGLGSMPGAILGGLGVGLAATLGVVYVSSAYTDAYPYVLMLVVLLIRPAGLFSRTTRTY